MKQILIDRYGPPEEVARCAQVPDVGAPAAGEVVFDVLAFPINPADVSFCKGTYRLKPPLPATPGAECVGRVTAVGAGLSHVKPAIPSSTCSARTGLSNAARRVTTSSWCRRLSSFARPPCCASTRP